MLEQALLREQVQALLAKEQQAALAYAELSAKAASDEVREQLAQLHREKQRHIRLAERLLEILD